MTGAPRMEKRLLQIAVAAAALVPVAAGVAGAIWGPVIAGSFTGAALDSHFRYLSGVLLGVGLAYWSLIPAIEREGSRLFMLTLIVVIGGFCRAIGALIHGLPGPAMSAALVMELVVAPGVYLWQTRIARLASMDAPSPWR
jgi:hypothetical protein